LRHGYNENRQRQKKPKKRIMISKLKNKTNTGTTELVNAEIIFGSATKTTQMTTGTTTGLVSSYKSNILVDSTKEDNKDGSIIPVEVLTMDNEYTQTNRIQHWTQQQQ
jgi:hypothetical protein